MSDRVSIIAHRGASGLCGQDNTLASFKLAETRNWLVIRLFEPTGNNRTTLVEIPSLGLSFDVSLGKYEIKTLACDLKSKRLFETDLLERELDE